MLVSSIYKHTGSLVEYSPNGQYLAIVCNNHLSIRETETFQISQLFTCRSKIKQMQWHADSVHLFVLQESSIVRVFHRADLSYRYEIQNTVYPPILVGWASFQSNHSSSYLFIVSEFQLQFQIWSLQNDKCVFVIDNPKIHDKRQLEAVTSGNSKYIAVPERSQCQDFIGIYSYRYAENSVQQLSNITLQQKQIEWYCLNRFVVQSTDLAQIRWICDDTFLAIIDTYLSYRILIYTPKGEYVKEYNSLHTPFGIKSFAPSVSNKMFFLGGYDETVRIIGTNGWDEIATLQHKNILSSMKRKMDKQTEERVKETVVYKENDGNCVLVSNANVTSNPANPSEQNNSKELFRTLRINQLKGVPNIKPNWKKLNPKIGIQTLLLSPCETYIVTLNENMPNLAFIWEIKTFFLQSIVWLQFPIRAVTWDPKKMHSNARLLLCSGRSHLFVWTMKSMQVVPTGHLKVYNVQWCPGKDDILLIGVQESAIFSFV